MLEFKISYTDKGNVLCIHFNRGSETEPMWATLPFNPQTKRFEPQSDIDKQLLEEAQSLPEWVKLDLSDRAPTPIPPPAPDWAGLLNDLRATPVFGKVYTASKNNLAINVAYTLLLSTLTATEPNINDLAFALKDLKANMQPNITASNASLTANIQQYLTAEDLNFINGLLSKHYFPVSV